MAEVRDAPNLVDYENMTATDLELSMRDSIICNEMMETDSVMCNGMVESGDGTYYELFMALDCANLGDLINYTLLDIRQKYQMFWRFLSKIGRILLIIHTVTPLTYFRATQKV